MACWTTSKVCGIVVCERSWGDVKEIKLGKRVHMNGKFVEKQTILYSSARVNEARIRQMELEKIDPTGPGVMFRNEDTGE